MSEKRANPFVLDVFVRYTPEYVNFMGRRFPLRETLGGALDRGIITVDPRLFELVALTWADARPWADDPGGGTTGPIATDMIYPAEVRIVTASAWHPSHGDIPFARHTDTADGVETWTPRDTSSFEDGTGFVLNLGYFDGKGDGIKFHDEWDTPATHHLNHSSRIVVTTGQGTDYIAGLGPGEVELDGDSKVLNVGPQTEKEYIRTRGMDPRVKLLPASKGGPGGGDEVNIRVFAPGGPAGTKDIAATLVVFTVR